jgi:zinc transporter 1/2/3
VRTLNGIILCVAIGVHEFFEGIAFGLMPTAEQAIQLAIGVLIHKGAAAISIGGTFTRADFTFKQILLCLSLFSISAPIGTIIGMSLTESNLVCDTVFMGLAGGTFIYVSCNEIIVREFSKGGHNLIKLGMVIAGIILITSLRLIEDDHNM